MKKVQFIIIATILSFGLIISAALLSNAIHNANKSENRITVKGVAEKRIKADRVFLNIIFSTVNVNLEKGRETVDKKRQAALDILNNLDLKENEYQINNIKIKPKFSERQQERETRIISYDLMQSITVSPKNIDRIDKIYEKLQELKLTFNNMEITEPEYYIAGIEKYKKDMLVEASRNAEMKAVEMLKVNENEISGLESMVQGQFEILQDTEDIKSIGKGEANQPYKKLRSVVTVTYSIKY